MEQGAESSGDRVSSSEGRSAGADHPRGWRPKLASWQTKRHVSSRGPWVGLGIGVLLFLLAVGAVWIERHQMVGRIEALERELAAARGDREAVGSALRSEVERVAAIESLIAEIRLVSQSMTAQIETLDRLASRALVEAGAGEDRLAVRAEGESPASAEAGRADEGRAEAGEAGAEGGEAGKADAGGEVSPGVSSQERSTTTARRGDSGGEGASRSHDGASSSAPDAI